MRHLEWRHSMNEGVTLSTDIKSVIAKNNSICTADKMNHFARPKRIQCLTVFLNTDLNKAFAKIPTLPNVFLYQMYIYTL